jgi:uncharacterized membrane protein YdcZ (DUF606 family)
MIGQRLGILEGVIIIHLGGAVTALVPLLFMEGRLGDCQRLPWYCGALQYVLCGGFLGLVVVSAMAYMLPRIGMQCTDRLVVS